MSSFTIIRIIARFEIKTLLRSWFFRIFSILAIIILTFYNVITMTETGSGLWIFHSIPSSVPYVNMLLLNVIQAIIAVFLASDFLKRDSKLDTTEVIYIRSMTNGVYVLGKTLGIIIVFLGLNFIVLFIAGMINVFVPDVPFSIYPYLWYPFLISLPTLVFIFGLSFLFMVIIKNQAVTFIVLLGYIATTLFFLSGKLHHLFDYMAFTVPLMYSDFVGFGNISEILIHRGIYFFFGLGFIFITILLLRRLPQSKIMTRFSILFSILFILAGLMLGNSYLSRIFGEEELRQQMVELNNKQLNTPLISVTQSDIDLTHNEDKIQVGARLILKNNTTETINRYIFSLNPGLDVQSVKSGQIELKFTRDFHLLTVEPVHPLSTQSLDSLTIKYGGVIDERICYLDVEETTKAERKKSGMLTIDKRFAFVSPAYVLLTPESYWYPVAGVGYSSDFPGLHTQQFVQFTLNVTTEKDLFAIAQGKAIEQTNGSFSFRSEFPISQLSLAIGKYEKQSITVDSVEYNLFILNKHDYFSEYLADLGDTLPVLIREMKQDYERTLNLPYVYSRFSLVEVPVQFTSFQRLWTTGQETVQPEMVLLPEKGSLISDADFKRMKRSEERRIERANQVVSPKEIQVRMFFRFVTSTFTLGISRTRLQFGSSGMPGPPAISTSSIYSIYPNYYSFVYHLKSDDWPVLNMAMESFLDKGAASSIVSMFSGFTGLSQDEKTNLALQGNNLPALIASEDDQSIVYNAIKSKGKSLFTFIQSKVGDEEFDDFLYNMLDENKFSEINIKKFNERLLKEFGFDLKPYIEEWYNNRELPGVLISDINGYKVFDEDRSRFQVTFKISNPEPADGLVVVSFRTFGGGRGMGGGMGGGGGLRTPGMGFAGADHEQIIHIPANHTKEIAILLDAAPRLMSVNTLISKNIPSTLSNIFGTFELDKKAVPFESERLIEYSPEASEPDEIIVDNEDSGFKVIKSGSESALKKLLNISSDEDKEKYVSFRLWRPPLNWQATTNSAFHGKYIRSAYFTKASTGNSIAIWNAEIIEGGYYDVYYYVPQLRMSGMRGRGMGGGQGSGQPQEEIKDEYHFSVYHDDGKEEVILGLKNIEYGWNHLGSYYLSPDSAKVELSNESPGRVVIADAVKWVKQ
ncbi:MAG: hypothetical protein GH151_12615 [Bacteroidetes bacterium]|nr:hypothetical protein [Bacteroidota bacterium]